MKMARLSAKLGFLQILLIVMILDKLIRDEEQNLIKLCCSSQEDCHFEYCHFERCLKITFLSQLPSLSNLCQFDCLKSSLIHYKEGQIEPENVPTDINLLLSYFNKIKLGPNFIKRLAIDQAIEKDTITTNMFSYYFIDNYWNSIGFVKNFIELKTLTDSKSLIIEDVRQPVQFLFSCEVIYQPFLFPSSVLICFLLN